MDNSLPLILSTLREKVRETFETLTFSEVSSWEISSNIPDSTDSWIGAAIDIHQPICFRFMLLLDIDQCREFVETAYGPEIIDDPACEGILKDYVGELVNTIAGRLAASLTPPDGIIELGLPQPCGMPSRDEKTTAVTFILEEKAVWCFLDLNPFRGI